METKEAHFLELLEAHKGVLYKICRMYQDLADDQADLMQEIVLQLWSSYDSFRGESQFSTWLYRVALNTAIVFFKREKRRQDNLTLSGYTNRPDDRDCDKEKEQQLQLFYRAVQELDRLEKALVLLYMQEQTSRQIAVILGITPVNVRVRLNRVKNKLKEIIKAKGHEY